MLDGFVHVTDLGSGLESNLHYYRNQVSPYARFARINFRGSPGIVADKYYGYSYDFDLPPYCSVYAETSKLPEYSGDELENFGFLRIPFRRIPRIFVRNRAQLGSLIRSVRLIDPNRRLLFRGQTKEYLLPRSAETLLALYGQSDVKEPSLLPSSARRGRRIEEILPGWMGLLQLFLERTKANLAKSGRNGDHLCYLIDNLMCSFNLSLFALSLAQHYGLPSVGLDTTSDIEIALFFALNEFGYDLKRPNWQRFVRKVTRSELSVIYIFYVPERFYLAYEQIRPIALPALRPERQAAFFLPTGWGLHQNGCARYLLAAIYLDPAISYETIDDYSHLFPGPEEDMFGNFLQDVRMKLRPSLLRQFVSEFKWAAAISC